MKFLLVCLVWVLISFNTGTFTVAKTSEGNDNFNMDFTKSELIIFVKYSGSDIPNCGTQKVPCKSMKYVLKRVSQLNATSALINVLPGVYPPETVKLDCSMGKLRSVAVRGFGENITIRLTADIVKCNVTFANVHWTNSTKPILINAIISRLRIINSTISDIAFSLLSSGSNIEFISCSITKSTGWQPLFPMLSATGITGFESNLSLQNSNFSYNKAPLVSAKAINLVAVKKCFFALNIVNKGQVVISIAASQGFIDDVTLINNTGGNIKLIEGSVVNMTRVNFLGNRVLDSTLLHVSQGVILRVSSCSFVQTHGTSSGPVMMISEDIQAANFTSCYFSCNQVNNSMNVSPIKNNAASSIVKYTNSTSDPNCPVFCAGGEYLVDGVMCLSCPAGTYSPGREFNVTTFACKKCSPGYYSPRAGSSSCTPCKPGSFAAKSGSKMCSLCKNDLMTSSEGAASCSKLTVGFAILTVCVVLLILFPLVTLLIQYLQTSTKWIPKNQKRFRRLDDTASRT